MKLQTVDELCIETHLSSLSASHGEAEERRLVLVSGHLELREGGGVTFDGLTDLALDRVQLHGADDAVLLCANADEEEPLERGVSTVVDDLTTGQTRVSIEHLQRLRVTCTTTAALQQQ